MMRKLTLEDLNAVLRQTAGSRDIAEGISPDVRLRTRTLVEPAYVRDPVYPNRDAAEANEDAGYVGPDTDMSIK